MKTIYCINCNKYRKFENPETGYIFDKILVISLFLIILIIVITKKYLKKKNHLRY